MNAIFNSLYDATVLKEIIDSNAVNLDVKNPEGDTPLMMAVKKDNPAIVKILLESGANVSRFDANGNSVLHVARTAEMSELLISYCKDIINHQNDDKETALSHAVSYDNLACANIYLKNGARVVVRRMASYVHCTSPEMYKLLIEYDIDGHFMHEDMADYAINRGIDYVDVLIKAGYPSDNINIMTFVINSRAWSVYNYMINQIKVDKEWTPILSHVFEMGLIGILPSRYFIELFKIAPPITDSMMEDAFTKVQNTGILRTLLEAKGNPNAHVDGAKWTLLSYSRLQKTHKITELLLEFGAMR